MRITSEKTDDFTLWRQDDNGIKARVADYPNRQAAEQARKHFEALGHKQLYWVEDNRRADTI